MHFSRYSPAAAREHHSSGGKEREELCGNKLKVFAGIWTTLPVTATLGLNVYRAPTPQTRKQSTESERKGSGEGSLGVYRRLPSSSQTPSNFHSPAHAIRLASSNGRDMCQESPHKSPAHHYVSLCANPEDLGGEIEFHFFSSAQRSPGGSNLPCFQIRTPPVSEKKLTRSVAADEIDHAPDFHRRCLKPTRQL